MAGGSMKKRKRKAESRRRRAAARGQQAENEIREAELHDGIHLHERRKGKALPPCAAAKPQCSTSCLRSFCFAYRVLPPAPENGRKAEHLGKAHDRLQLLQFIAGDDYLIARNQINRVGRLAFVDRRKVYGNWLQRSVRCLRSTTTLLRLPVCKTPPASAIASVTDRRRVINLIPGWPTSPTTL